MNDGERKKDKDRQRKEGRKGKEKIPGVGH